MIKVAILGAAGRMGIELVELVKRSDELMLSGASCGNTELYGQRLAGTAVCYANSADAVEDAQVVIDFSVHSAVEAHLQTCLDANVAYVCGVTGLDERLMGLIDRAAQSIPVFWAPNMSVGVSACLDAARNIAKQLEGHFAVHVFDLHHAGKKDAPSGTALEFARVIKEAADHVEIEFESVREGHNPGKHQITFEQNSQVIELHHQAGSRTEFAEGALQAAIYLSKMLPGRYNMRNLLENKLSA